MSDVLCVNSIIIGCACTWAPNLVPDLWIVCCDMAVTRHGCGGLSATQLLASGINHAYVWPENKIRISIDSDVHYTWMCLYACIHIQERIHTKTLTIFTMHDSVCVCAQTDTITYPPPSLVPAASYPIATPPKAHLYLCVYVYVYRSTSAVFIIQEISKKRELVDHKR